MALNTDRTAASTTRPIGLRMNNWDNAQSWCKFHANMWWNYKLSTHITWMPNTLSSCANLLRTPKRHVADSRQPADVNRAMPGRSLLTNLPSSNRKLSTATANYGNCYQLLPTSSSPSPSDTSSANSKPTNRPGRPIWTKLFPLP